MNDDIHFVTGRRPIKYWRMLWYTYPVILMGGIGLLVLDKLRGVAKHKSFIEKDFPDSPFFDSILFVALGIVFLYLLIIFIGTFFYIVMAVRTLSTIVHLLKPQFYWGPFDKDMRIARKSFAPRTSIRSQPPKKKRQRFRMHSIKQMHERDIAEHVNRGRIFLDSIFFTNVGEEDRRRQSQYLDTLKMIIRHRRSTLF